MTALTAARNTVKLGDEAVPVLMSIPVKASTKIYAGSLVAVNAGYAVPVSASTALKIIGRAESTVDNTSGSDGTLTVQVSRGVFRWANGDTIVQADVWKIAYGLDDQTVTKGSGTGARSIAGMIIAVDSDGVWVESKGPPAEIGAEVAGAAVPDIAGTLTGTADGTMVDVAATASAVVGGATPTAAQVDTGIALAVSTIVTGVNTQNKETLTKVNAILAALRTAGIILP